MTGRRKFITQLTMAASAATFLRPLNIFAAGHPRCPEFQNKLTILHTANLNGQRTALLGAEKLTGLGGWQQLAPALKKISSTAASLVIHTGNIGYLGDESEPYLYKTMYDTGYDLVCPCTGSLPAGSPAANQTSYLPYTIVQKGPLRIGIIQAIAGNSHFLTSLATTINKTAGLLRSSKNCSLIISLTPPPVNGRHPLIALTAGVDVILSSYEKQTIHNVEIIRNNAGEEVFVSYAGSSGTTISQLDLTFGNELGKTGFDSKTIFVGTKEEYAGIMKQYHLRYA